MIEKERLKELIIQNATIYGNGFGEIELIPDNDISIYKNGNNGYILYVLEPNKKYKNEIFAEELFETKEEAEWHKEFGCIERTERLLLPTWEEFKNKKIKCVCFTGKSTNCLYEMFIDKKDRIQLYDHDCEYYYFNKKATKENYTLACRKCKELFLGNDN